jgi:tetratricopeptide (TPR) repeat protein
MSWEESINRGTLALARSDYETAKTAFKDALTTAQLDFVDGDQRLCQTFSFLGQTYYKLGDHQQAQNYLTLSTKEDDSSEQDSLRVAVDHLSLAQMNYVSGQATDAHEHFAKALCVLKTAKALNADSALEATAGLEKLLRTAAKKEAEKTNATFRNLLVQAQKNHRPKSKTQEYFGTEPEAIVDAWQNLMETGAGLTEKADLDSLITGFQNLNSALRIALSIFPSNHQNIAESMTSLANVTSQLGLCEDAVVLYKEALKICETNNSEPIKKAMLKINIASFYSNQFDHQAAIESLSEAAEIVQQDETLANSQFADISNSFYSLMQKADIHRSARDMIRQAIEFEENDRLEQANYCYENSLALTERIFGETHLEVAQILLFKANVLRKLGEKQQAEKAQDRAEQIESEITERAHQLEQLKANLPAIRYTK